MVRFEDLALIPGSLTPNDPDHIRLIRDCGFNCAGLVTRDTLDTCHRFRLKAFLVDEEMTVGPEAFYWTDSEIDRRVRLYTESVKAHPALYAYFINDEPGADLFPVLRRVIAAFKRHDPQHPALTNLFPNYCDLSRLGTRSYREYLDRAVRELQLKVLSYDHYAIMDDGTIRDGYFANLADARAVALKYSVPCWNIVLSNAHFNFADPSPASLRFQAWTSLAYGIRGIGWFTYDAPAVGNYRLAPVDQFGHATETWAMLRNVLHTLSNVAPHLCTLHSHCVYGTRTVGVPQAPRNALLREAEGERLLIGEFLAPDHTEAAVVVNTSLTRSTPVDLAFRRPGQIQMINPWTGRTTPFTGEQRWLAPGQGVLIINAS